MKQFLLVLSLAFILLGYQAIGQTILFSENFEGTVQMTSSTTGSGNWGTTSQLFSSGGIKADSAVVTPGDSIMLTTPSFSTMGLTNVILEFDQICKIEFADGGFLEVSTNGGTSWILVSGSQYLGPGQFGNIGNHFSSGSYPIEWLPTQPNVVPSNSWWKHEVFDLSLLIANQSNVKFRFRLTDGTYPNGSGGSYGWLIDNLVIKGALSELIPPSIALATPLVKDSVFNKGPYQIFANISDASGISSAKLIYRYNSGAWDTLTMNGGGSNFNASIPYNATYVYGDQWDYYIIAEDASLSHNSARYPASSNIVFKYYPPLPPPSCGTTVTVFPYIENFETGVVGVPGTLPTGWVMTPTTGYAYRVHTGTTPTINTGPDFDHTTGTGKYVYAETDAGTSGDVAYLYSPCLNITNVAVPSLEFWYHMYGSTINYMKVQVWSGNQFVDLWTKSGDQGNSWKKAEINLSNYKGLTQLRFIVSRAAAYYGDIALDDIKVWQPPMNDVGVTELNYPNNPALSGNNPVHITVKNFGSNMVDSLKVNWKVNGVAQPTYNWTGNLAQGTQMDSLLIGNYNFVAGEPQLSFWTTAPNGVSDALNANDTLHTNLIVCDGYLRGNYSVGTLTSDFATLSSALYALYSCGIDSTVILNMASGVYTGQITLTGIPGTGPNNRVIIQSATGVKEDVEFTYAATATTDNWVVKLNNNDYVTFKNVTINATGDPYAYGVVIENGSDFNSFEGCLIKSTLNTYSYSIPVRLNNTTATSNFNTFDGNTIFGGYYGLYLYGSSSIRHKGTVAINNEISNYYYYGLYTFYLDSAILNYNYIHDGIYTTNYALSAYYLFNHYEVIGNRVIISSVANLGYGLRDYYCNYSTYNPNPTGYGIIANNFISSNATASNYGLYSYNTQGSIYSNNSVYVGGGSSINYALYQYNSTLNTIKVRFKNNSFAAFGSGSSTNYAGYYNTVNNVIENNYNNYYTNGSALAYWGGSAQATLADLKAASLMDSYSINVNPEYLSNTNLHSSSIGMNNAATPDTLVPYDIDMQPRSSTTPDIGADEYMLYSNNAGIQQWVRPTQSCSGDTLLIKVKLKNYGINTITSVKVNWSIDGVLQPQFTYAGSLLPGLDTILTIDTNEFLANHIYSVKFWSSLPNAVADQNPMDDTLMVADYSYGLPGGTYILGSSASADFTDANALMSLISKYGICGPVVINVENGSYNANIKLINTPGLNQSNTLTIKSLSGDSNLVVFTYATSAVNPSLIHLTNANYVTIKGIKFVSTGSGIGYGVYLGVNASYNTVQGCLFGLVESTGSSFAGIYYNSSSNNYNKFINNTFNNGYYGIYGRGSSSASLAKGNQIIGNTFNNYYNYGTYLYYNDSIIFRNNILTASNASAYQYGMYIAYGDNKIDISGNILTAKGSTTNYGAYFYNCDGTALARGNFSNNIINITNGTGTNYGLYTSYSYYLDITNNTVVILNGSGVSSRAFYPNYGGNLRVHNNIFDAKNGYSVYQGGTTSIAESDYNNYYTTGSYFAYYNSSAKADLASYITATGKDVHSISEPTTFASATNLHTRAGAVNGAGIPRPNVLVDVDGELRDTLAPDMGADEFTPASKDLVAYGFDISTTYCSSTFIDVTVIAQNMGSDTVKGNFALKYSIDGTNWVSENVNDTINPLDSITYTFSTQLDISTLVDTIFNIKYVVNISGDAFSDNDTTMQNINSYITPASPIVSDSSTNYASTGSLTATGNGSIFWYSSPSSTTPISSGSVFTTPVLFDTTSYYIAAQTANGCFSNKDTATINVLNIPIADLGITDIHAPEGCGVTNSESITITFYNQGYGNTPTTYQASYRINNNAWITPETISAVVGSGATVSYTFTTPVNMFAATDDTTFLIDAYVMIVGDPYHLNDSIFNEEFEVLYTPANPTVVSPLSVTYGTYASLSATSNDTVNWYNTNDMVNDTIEFATGSPVMVGPMWASDTFYVQAVVGTGGIVELGNGTTTNSSPSSYPSPYSNWYWGNKEQYIYTATELTSLGYSSGPILSLAFNVSAVNSCPILQNFEIKIGNTTTSSFSTSSPYITSGLVTVYTSSGYQPVGGWNQHIFSTPFLWDGVSNIVVQVCFNNSSYVSNGNAQIFCTTFTNNVASNTHADATGVCASATNPSNVYTLRPNIKFNIVGSGCTSNRIPLAAIVSSPPAVDAGAEAFISPIGGVGENTPTPVIVTIKNYGTSNLTSASIVYERNNMVKDTFNWVGNLAQFAVSTPIIIYTDNFTPGNNTIRAWVINANNIPTAGVNLNDTISSSVRACMHGSYTIGTTGDFTTLNNATNTLLAAGVCSPVVFNIQAGTYNEQLVMQEVDGMSEINTVTFQSANLDSTSVLIDFTAPSSTNNYVAIFYGGNYYKVRNLSIKGNGTYANTVVYYDNASFNTIENCIISSTVGATSSSQIPIYDYSTSNGIDNKIYNNIVKNGYYGIYLYGTSAYAEKGFEVVGNQISDFYYYGIYSYNQDSLILNYNKIRNGSNSNTNPRGMMVYYSQNYQEVIGNEIIMTPAIYGYGLYLYYGLVTSNNYTKRVANNAITIDGGIGTSYGVYLYNYNNSLFAHNSINMVNNAAADRGLYQSAGTNLTLVNNNIYAERGYAYYIGTPSVVVGSNKNNLFAANNNLAYWNGDRANLDSLKTQGTDLQSISFNPDFLSNDNLRTFSIDLNNKGVALSSEVPKDIDKNLRNITNPDLGASEYNPKNIDLAVYRFDSPVNPTMVGLNPVKVSLRNMGLNTITSTTINWSVNNVPQAPFAFSGSIASGLKQDTVTIGNLNVMTAFYDFKVWSSNPNSVADENNHNDTIKYTVIGCNGPMRGNYTLGTASSDFIDFDQARIKLMACGVDSHVVINVAPGIYNTQIEFGVISGVTDSSTVVFQSANLDSTSVTLSFSSIVSKNYIVRFNGTKYVTLRSMKLQSNVATAGRVVVIENDAKYITIEGCILEAPEYFTNASTPVYTTKSSNITFHNNVMNGGYASMYLYGTSLGSLNYYTITKNIFNGFRNYGIYNYYSNKIVISDNYLENGSGFTFGYGIYSYYSTGPNVISGNDININPTTSAYGLYLYNNTGTVSAPNTIFNNSVSIINPSSASISYGVYHSSSTYQHFVNNTFHVHSNSNSRCFYNSGGGNNKLLNNNFVGFGNGQAIYNGTASAITVSDYNNFYVSGATLGYWGANVANLAALQSASGKDANSVSANPDFTGTHDLHATSVNLNANATPVSYVTMDQDGNLRDTLTPDIGAYEFTPKQWDVAMKQFLSPSINYGPAGNSIDVKVRFKNLGFDTLTNLDFTYIYAGSTPVTQSWAGLLTPGDTASITFSTSFTALIGANLIKAYVVMANDSNQTNDTIAMYYGGLSTVTPDYIEDFDNAPSKWIPSGTEWELGTPQGTIITTAHSTPNAWMTKLSTNYSNNVNESLLSPFVNFSGTTGTTLKFWINYNLAAGERVTFQYSTNGGSTWITLGYKDDPLSANWYNTSGGGLHYWAGNSNGWVEATYLLTQFDNASDPIQFKLNFYSDASANADGFAFDDPRILLPVIPYDAGVISIDAPVASTVMGSNNNIVTVTLRNNGSNTLMSIPVKYSVNGGTPVTGTANISGGLASGATHSFTFPATFQSPVTNYELCAWTTLPNDTYEHNDTACANFNVTAPNIEAYASYITVNPRWADTTKVTYATTVTLRIKNLGTDALSNIPVQYLINGSPYASEVYSGTIAVGDSLDYTFNTTFHCPINNYLLCGKIIMPGDPNPNNDNTCITLFGMYDVNVNGIEAAPFTVDQNQPNPAHGMVHIGYFVPRSGEVSFELRNLMGQVLIAETRDAVTGNNSIEVNAQKLASGVYYYTVMFQGERITYKMVVNQ